MIHWRDMRRIAALLLVGLCSPLLAFAATPDPGSSSIGVDKTEATADGIDGITVRLRILDTNLLAYVGGRVVLSSSRGALDEIMPAEDLTDSLGRASFIVRSLKDGLATFTATIDGQPLGKSVSATFVNGLSLQLPVGSLIKIPDDGNVDSLSDTAVYYYASNGRRYVFPNEKTYFTWYPDFTGISVIPVDQMSLIPIGGNVTYRPASRLVKFQTDVKTYLVAKGGVLRWVKTEEVARGLYGDNWNTKTDDISEAFYVNYTFGEPIDHPLAVSLTIIADSARTINANLGFGNP